MRAWTRCSTGEWPEKLYRAVLGSIEPWQMTERPRSLLALTDRDPSPATDDLLSKITVFTWRGMMTKLLLAVYEVESAATRGGGRAEGWEMNAMMLDVSSRRPSVIDVKLLTRAAAHPIT